MAVNVQMRQQVWPAIESALNLLEMLNFSADHHAVLDAFEARSASWGTGASPQFRYYAEPTAATLQRGFDVSIVPEFPQGYVQHSMVQCINRPCILLACTRPTERDPDGAANRPAD